MQPSLSGVFFSSHSFLLPETRFWALVSVLSTTENPNIPLTIMHLCTRVPPPSAPLSNQSCNVSFSYTKKILTKISMLNLTLKLVPSTDLCNSNHILSCIGSGPCPVIVVLYRLYAHQRFGPYRNVKQLHFLGSRPCLLQAGCQNQ